MQTTSNNSMSQKEDIFFPPTEQISLYSLLTRRAELTPNATALMAPGRRPLTYLRLYDQIEATASYLRALEIKRNARVGIVLPNGPEMAAAFLAVTACATSAPLNPAYRASEFDFYLSDLKASAVLVAAGLDSPVRAVARNRNIPVIELSPVPEAEAGIFTLACRDRADLKEIEFAKSNDMALVLHTSGTTSRPKIVPLTQANICASGLKIQATLNLGLHDRCLNVMPLFHIHGLIGALMSSLTAGAAIACTPGFHAPQFFKWLEELDPTWYTAVPTMHQGILARARANQEIIEQSRLRFIRSSSSPLPLPLISELEDVFKVPVIEAYGMTEASHQMTSNPLPPRQRKPGSVGVAAGAEVAIMNETGDLIGAGETGEIVVRGDGITQGYEANPAANQQAFVNAWFRTGDQGYLDSDGYLFITGRIKEIINRGGEKLSPREVDEVILTHPAIAQAVTFAVPDNRLGEEVAAAVVLHPDAITTEREIRQFATSRLADFKVPRRVVILDELPKGPTGKVQRIGLAEKLGLTAIGTPIPRIAAAYAAPRNKREETLADIWGEVLGIERVGIHDDFFQLGGDSVLAALIISRARETAGLGLQMQQFFEEPTIAAMAKNCESTSSATHSSFSSSLSMAPRESPLPLSYPQQRLWLVSQLEESVAYTSFRALHLSGDTLNVEALCQAVEIMIGRHESLRTHFVGLNGSPAQVIAEKVESTTRTVDLCGSSEPAQKAILDRLIAEEVRRPFDLTQSPLFRVVFLRLGAGNHVLLLTIHHLISDGWSIEIFFQEQAALYGSLTGGRPSPLAALPIQYVDYAQWQRQWMQGEELKGQLSYWKKHLEGELPTLQLPSRHPYSSVTKSRGSKQRLRLPKDVSDALRALAQQEGLTRFILLLAAFQALLHRYTNQSDIIVGSTIAGRNRTETEGLIGFFVNTLLMRTDLSGDPGFRQLLARVRKVALDAYARQDVPFDLLVRELQPERESYHTPLFQVMFQLRNIPIKPLELPGLEVREIEINSGTAKFYLSLDVIDEPGGLNCICEYNVDLFDAVIISRMLGHFQILLQGIVNNPQLEISRLSLLSEPELHQALLEWNETEAELNTNMALHQLIEAEANRVPEAVAIEFEEYQVSYYELNVRANQLARHLRRLGVAPDVVVGICVERSVEMIVGLLGILKAGGAYLPLDPSYPPQRLALMVEGAQVPVVLTQQRLESVVSCSTARLSSVQIFCLDSDWEFVTGEPTWSPINQVLEQNLVYVIYTSGSTGQPKGVMNTHQGVCNHMLWMRRQYRVNCTDRVLQKTPFGFDVSAYELFLPLMVGARLVIARPEGHKDNSYLVQMVIEQEITILHFVASMLRAFIEEPGVERCHSLKQVFCSGEELPYELQERFFSGLSAPLQNIYGPTEAAIHVTFWECELERQRMVPIGRPVANTRLYVLGQRQSLIGALMQGGAYIGGPQLARGYLKGPDLTAERFVPDPFADSGARLYQTGDLARYREDGAIEYLGRIDQQVKIRGNRVELGEIESALRRHPLVREAVILAREDEPGNKRLVAYIVATGESTLSRDALRSYLKVLLPDYMIPSLYVMLEALPLGINGKVDRQSLPAPILSSAESKETFVAPRTLVEEILAEIWSEVLGLPRIGVHDNFFHLGGHSLLGTQIISRLCHAFEARLSLTNLFTAPTIAELAVVIIQQQAGRAKQEEIAQILAELGSLTEEEAQRLYTSELNQKISR